MCLTAAYHKAFQLGDNYACFRERTEHFVECWQGSQSALGRCSVSRVKYYLYFNKELTGRGPGASIALEMR